MRLIFRNNGYYTASQSSERIDFPALGQALQSMKLGTVDLKRLAQKHGDTEFLTELIKKEMGADDHPDALVFAGPENDAGCGRSPGYADAD